MSNVDCEKEHLSSEVPPVANWAKLKKKIKEPSSYLCTGPLMKSAH